MSDIDICYYDESEYRKCHSKSEHWIWSVGRTKVWGICEFHFQTLSTRYIGTSVALEEVSWEEAMIQDVMES